MKKFTLGVALLTIGAVVFTVNYYSLCFRKFQVVSLNENNATENVVIEYTEDGMVVTKYEDGYSAEDFANSSDIMTRACSCKMGQKGIYKYCCNHWSSC